MDMDLDTTRQKDLYEQACRDMAHMLPGWKDTFPSDPAVAVLELFTYLSDIQNYVLNQIEDAHYLAYCRLLMAQPRQLTPARMLALPPADGPCHPGQRFETGGIPFEVSKAPEPGVPQVAQVAWQEKDGARPSLPGVPLLLGGEIPGRLTVSLTGPLPAGRPWRLWCTVEPEAGRNPPADKTPPPVKLHSQIPSGGAWLDAACEDGTHGFLQSGPITVTLPAPADTVAFSITGAWEGEPVLSSMVLEPAELTQRHTRSACLDLAPPFSLPEAWRSGWKLFYFTQVENGWRREETWVHKDGQITGWHGPAPRKIRVVAAEPDFAALRPLRGIAMEELALEEEGVWPQSLQVMVEEDGLWQACPVCLPEEERTLPRGCRWEPERRAIRFGDGRDYLPPQPGQALICGCALTLGSAANGAGGTLAAADGAVLTALVPAQGGEDRESPRDAFARAAREQEQPLRAVSCRDYEALARRTPGLALEQVRCLPFRALGRTGPGVVVLAKPGARRGKPTLNAWQRERLLEFLEPYRMLGVPLEVREPRYCPLRIRATLVTSEPVEESELRRAVLPLADGVDGPLDFGAEVSYTALYAALGGVEGVRFVRALELTALAGGVVRCQDGSIFPAPDMLPCLTELDISQVQ